MAKEPETNDRPLFSWYAEAGLGSGDEDREDRIILAMGLHQQQDRRRRVKPVTMREDDEGGRDGSQASPLRR